VVFKNMSINNSFSGYGFAPEYQLSGLPYVTGIAIVDTRFKIEFPYVAQWFYLRFTQTARTASISFESTDGTTPNTISFESSSGNLFFGPFFLRIKDLNIESTHGVYVIAGLTSIPRSCAPSLVSSFNSSVTGSLSPVDTNYFIYSGI